MAHATRTATHAATHAPSFLRQTPSKRILYPGKTPQKRPIAHGTHTATHTVRHTAAHTPSFLRKTPFKKIYI